MAKTTAKKTRGAPPQNNISSISAHIQSQDKPHSKVSTRIEKDVVTKPKAVESRANETKKVHSAALSPIQQAFSFLNLPPEVRNMIYRHLFIVNEIFTSTNEARAANTNQNAARGSAATAGVALTSSLTAQLDVFVEGDSRSVRWSLQPPYLHGGATNTNYNTKRRMPSGFSPSIFLLNRQLHTEATPVFYGANNFRFKSTMSLRAFLRRIGAHVTLLRNVELSGIWYHVHGTPSARDAARLLTAATNLQHLHIDTTSGWAGAPQPRPLQVARDFSTFFRAVFARAGNSLDGFWKVVTFGGGCEAVMVDYDAMRPGQAGPIPQRRFVDIFRHAVEADLLAEAARLGAVRLKRRATVKNINYAEF